ncbi:MAG: DUF2911 domain-containing protein [Saprospiraceae bacterium]|nr:DUF2911 domain-containing protein [Saprospiraceae bacterium]
MKNLFLLFTILFAGLTLSAQDENRAPSPSSTVMQKVGLTDIMVEYSRPGVKDREIFSEDGLQAYGKMWRTGANTATKITFSDDVKVEGNDIKAGSYSITSVPGAKSWKVNLYPYDGTRWSSYRDTTPAASMMITPEQIGSSVESFLIDINDLRDHSATMYLVWEKTAVPIKIEVK